MFPLMLSAPKEKTVDAFSGKTYLKDVPPLCASPETISFETG
jgi:hypothetical protein